MKTRWRLLRGLVAFVLVGLIAAPVIYEIAILVAPPYTPDGHPVMPIAHVALAILVSPIAGAIAAYFAARPRVTV